MKKFAALSLVGLIACSDSTVHLQPGQRYTVRSGVQLTPCPGQWNDYDRLDSAKSNQERLAIVLSDGGTTLLPGDSFTVVGFGSGTDAPVRIRSKTNGALCWLPNDVVQALLHD